VADIQSAAHINRLLEIQGSSDTVSACYKHPNEELKLYCKRCEEAICLKCAIKGGVHHDHHYEDLAQAFEKHKGEVESSLKPLKEHATVMKKALEQLGACCGEISNQQESVEQSIHTKFKEARDILRVRETELIDQLHKMTESKLKGLTVQKAHIETTLAQFNSYVDFMEESLEAGNGRDVMLAKTSTVKQLQAMADLFKPDTMKPHTKADMMFSSMQDFHTSCQRYGKLTPSLPRCHVRGKGLKMATVGEKSTLGLNFEGKRAKEPLCTLECVLVSQLTGNRTNCSITKESLSHYEVSYHPIIKGKHQLLITIDGQHIRGSPFCVLAVSPVKKLDIPIMTIDGVIGPVGITANQAGNIIVSEVDRGCISVLSLSGERFQLFSSRGSGPGQCQNPHGVVMDGEGNILVADSGNRRIQKFTVEGHFVREVGNDLLQLAYPSDIAFNASSRKVYVVDSGNHCIQVLNSNLTFHQTLGSHGRGKMQFSEPCGVACDSTGKVYVADSGNHRIQVFMSEGGFLRRFGKYGQGRGELNWPQYLAIDSSDSDTVYISESGNHRISVFTSEGDFITSFGRKGEGPGEFDFPCGIAVDCGIVYVCDGENNRIQVF
jgi:sugar lactone lactonase YvrE